MSFQTLAARSRTFASRVMASGTYAWFPATATTAPATRDGYSLRLSDVLQGAARRQASDMAGLINERDRTFPVSIPATLSYDPIEGETVFLCGTTKATAILCRVVAVRAAGGILELECRHDTQQMP